MLGAAKLLDAELSTLNSNFTFMTCFSFVFVVLEVVEVETLVLVDGFSSRVMALPGGPSEDEVIVNQSFVGFVAVGCVRFIKLLSIVQQ